MQQQLPLFNSFISLECAVCDFISLKEFSSKINYTHKNWRISNTNGLKTDWRVRFACNRYLTILNASDKHMFMEISLWWDLWISSGHNQCSCMVYQRQSICFTQLKHFDSHASDFYARQNHFYARQNHFHTRQNHFYTRQSNVFSLTQAIFLFVFHILHGFTKKTQWTTKHCR